MRVVILAILLLSILTGEKAFADYCGKPDEPMTVAPPPVDKAYYSSFRGLSLSDRPANVRWQAQALGFDTVTAYFLGSGIVSAVTMRANGHEVGRADFDRSGRITRLALKLRFFSEEPVFVRKFADNLFEAYQVRASTVDDDVCFQDVTCFRGITKFGEVFLILRIGTDTELYVREKRYEARGG